MRAESGVGASPKRFGFQSFPCLWTGQMGQMSHKENRPIPAAGQTTNQRPAHAGTSGRRASTQGAPSALRARGARTRLVLLPVGGGGIPVRAPSACSFVFAI